MSHIESCSAALLKCDFFLVFFVTIKRNAKVCFGASVEVEELTG